jgi:hypothetical protein
VALRQDAGDANLIASQRDGRTVSVVDANLGAENRDARATWCVIDTPDCP